METRTTPRPWTVEKLPHVGGELWLRIYGNDRHEVGEIGANEGKYLTERVVFEQKYLVYSEETQNANAALIVRAVNNHDALVAALELIARKVAPGYAWRAACYEHQTAALAALARSREES